MGIHGRLPFQTEAAVLVVKNVMSLDELVVFIREKSDCLVCRKIRAPFSAAFLSTLCNEELNEELFIYFYSMYNFSLLKAFIEFVSASLKSVE